MARKARVEYAGAVDPVLERGDRREPIFQDDADRRRFLETLGEVCRRTGWRVHADVLMTKHDPFLLETPEASLAAGMRWVPSHLNDKRISRSDPFLPQRVTADGVLRTILIPRSGLLGSRNA